MRPFNKTTQKILRQINWDYNITEKAIYNCLNGNEKKAGFLDRERLLLRLFSRINWYELVELFSFDEIKEILQSDFIKKLPDKKQRMKYEILRRILHKETLPPSKWNNSDNEFPEFPILSNRWHRPKQGIFSS